jgi:hypothetical protein
VHVAAVITVGLLVWAGTTLIFDGWMRRSRRPDLAERRRPLRPVDLADQARDWLDKTNLTVPSAEPEWVTVAEAARRLGMSAAWLKSFAKSEQITVVPRGGRPGVDWTTVEAYIARSRINLVDESLHRDPDRPVRGVPMLDRVQSRFGWSDRQLARALGVTPSVVSRYRSSGAPNFQACRLGRLSRLPVEGRPPPLPDGGPRVGSSPAAAYAAVGPLSTTVRPSRTRAPVTPAPVGSGVGNLPPPVASGLALCVRVARKAERTRGVARVRGRAGYPCSRPTHELLR